MSDVSLDQLRDYLVAGRWKKADKETARLLYIAVGLDDAEGPMFTRHLPSLEPSLLAAIDELWGAHSHGRFGFTPQATAWDRAEGDYELFATFVGWRRRSAYIMYAAANFDLSAPEGHLPIGGPNGIVFEDDTGLGILRELGEMGKTIYRDLGERGGVRRSAALIAKAKLLGDNDPPADFGHAMEWVGGRAALISHFRAAVGTTGES